MIFVSKAQGLKEEFSEEKLRNSIKRAGIPEVLQNQAVGHVKSKIYNGIETSEIYKHLMEFLGKTSSPYAKAKYGLKQGIIDLGPTGYPFEDFVAKILKNQGFETEVRSIISGKCVSHEIDIVAKKEEKKLMVECKFHNDLGIKSDVHVVLYTKARFDDVKDKNNFNQAWLVTNTKVTQDALTYANCSNMQIISWNYPPEGSLRELIEKSRLHPLTVLTTLSQSEKQKLLDSHLVLTKDICENPDNLDILGLTEEQKQTVLAESNFVCSLAGR